MKKIISLFFLTLLLIVPIFTLKAETKNTYASSTIKKLENRENNIERIRERLASTTASTSEKRMEKLNEQFQKQSEQMTKMRERLMDKESKVVSVIQKITDKITERIGILEAKVKDMTVTKANLALATAKLNELTTEANKMATLIETPITDINKDQIFIDIKTAQDKIKTLAKETKALLIDTVKEITK